MIISLSVQQLEKLPLPNGLGGFRTSHKPCAIPTLASKLKLLKNSHLQKPEEASASESASEINTGIRLNNYSGITRQSLAMTGFAARLV